jgi:hypothetical protein
VSQLRKFDFWLSVDEAAALKRLRTQRLDKGHGALFRNDLAHLENVIERICANWANLPKQPILPANLAPGVA